jgi:outer membrane biosynthesis protein TonB
MKKCATILILAALAAAAIADNPEADSTYFHPAASLYIQGSMAAASNLVARGLAEFPDDGKLKRLKELIEQQQQNEQNQDQQQNDEPQDDNDRDQEPQDDNDRDQEPQEQTKQQPEPQRAEQMSQDEAERLLDAMKQEEKNKRLELHPVMGHPVKVEKDW